MSTLRIFNAEHDYALADGHNHYYPPAGIIKLRTLLQYIPVLSAAASDYILLADGKVLSVDTDSLVSLESVAGDITDIKPWGWDAAIRSYLIGDGLEEALMPSPLQIDKMRRLSHRRISIACNRRLGSPHVPEEFFSVEDAVNYFKQNPKTCFKAPWSSSGRGVMFAEGLALHAVSEWIHGVIKKQGSVLAETAATRGRDFSSLWEVKEGEVLFRGLSVTRTDHRGRYRGNAYGPLQAIIDHIGVTAITLDNILEAQKEFIRTDISPDYEGRLGFDMLLDADGDIRPCIEINLRDTMGHIAIDIYNRLSSFPSPVYNKYLKKFSNYFYSVQ